MTSSIEWCHTWAIFRCALSRYFHRSHLNRLRKTWETFQLKKYWELPGVATCSLLIFERNLLYHSVSLDNTASLVSKNLFWFDTNHEPRIKSKWWIAKLDWKIGKGIPMINWYYTIFSISHSSISYQGWNDQSNI